MIKLDVEGSELAALEGMQRILQQCQPIVIIEVAEEAQARTGHTIGEIFDWFEQRHYSLRDEKDMSHVTAKGGRVCSTNLFAIPCSKEPSKPDTAMQNAMQYSCPEKNA